MPDGRPALFDRVPRGLFGPLGDPYAELYWELLAELYHHEFEREPFLVLRSTAIEAAEAVIVASPYWRERRAELEALTNGTTPTLSIAQTAGRRSAARVAPSPEPDSTLSGVQSEEATAIRALARRLVGRLEVWRESRLPTYLDRIREAKQKALQQLAEDVVFKLREDLLLVRRQIDELNRALKDVPFGSERYQFTVEIDPAHKAFHDLVIDAGRFEKESLFGTSALSAPELTATLGHLLDRLVEAEAREVKTELEAKADYREYFNYDLKILHADGRYSLYDRVSADKSGGETQTPY